MQEAQKALLEHLANALFQAPTEAEVTEAVIQEALHQSVISLLPIPKHKLYLQMLGNNLRVCYEHQQVHEMMQRNNIPYVIMKGVVSAAYYPEPMLRPMGDVDFLIGKEDIPRARQALEEAGYVEKKMVSAHHICYQAGGKTLELHFQAPSLPPNHVIHDYFTDIIDRAEFKDGCMQTSVFHHGMILLTHSAGHLIHSGIGLRHLCDWAVFYAAFSDEEFCALFEEPLKKTGLWRYAQLLSQTCVQYLGSPARKWLGPSDSKLLADIIDDIFDSGNFGYKNNGRIYQARLMTDTGNRSVSNVGPIANLFRVLKHRTCLEFPICKKVWLLLPFAMGFVSLKYVIWIAQGKRPAIHLKDAFTGAQKRKAIYQQFELYQAEGEQ